MISYTQQRTMYGDLSGNTATSNLTRGSYLANIEYRYLLQKYFSNEASYSITTVGAQSLTLTGTLASGAISATLTAAWLYYTIPVLVTFSSGEIRTVRFEKGSTAILWDAPLTTTATTAITVSALQSYPLPSDYSKLKTGTLTVGTLKWTPTEILTRAEWDNLNVFPYYSDTPNNFFIWQNQFNLWPIPSTSGNVISFNYKRRVPDLSLDDYTTGTISVSTGSVTVTGSGTTFTLTKNLISESRWIQFATGDNLWYQVASVDSTTQITLTAPYMGTTLAGVTYTLGQMPILPEDFQDMLVWKPLMFYYSTIKKDKDQFTMFEDLYKEKLKLLNEYAGQKTIDVNLGRRGVNRNPNLFSQTIG